MDTLTRQLKDLAVHGGAWAEPRVFQLHSDEDKAALTKLLEDHRVEKVFDSIEYAIGELYDIAYPAKKDTKTQGDVEAYRQKLCGNDAFAYGAWVYFPWSRYLAHFPPKNDLRALRTSRNLNLIRAEEQKALYDSTIMVVGLSVGSSAVEMLLSQGIGGTIILVDMDIIEPSNLNRIKTTYLEVGTHKVDMLARRISETDPYINQIHYRDGLNEQNLTDIINTYHPDVIIDEIDSLAMKITLRGQAKAAGIPVLMATDDGDNAILDIERYDIDQNQQLFEGRIPEHIIKKLLADELSRPEIGMLIGKYFVGAEHIPLRMFESLMEVGKTIPSWPQLAGAATLSGVTLAYAARKIILRSPLKAGRHIFDIDHELDPSISTAEYQQKVRQFQSKFLV